MVRASFANPAGNQLLTVPLVIVTSHLFTNLGDDSIDFGCFVDSERTESKGTGVLMNLLRGLAGVPGTQYETPAFVGARCHPGMTLQTSPGCDPS